jgi:hypothetical protein
MVRSLKMRDFFINSFEKLVGGVVILMIIGVVIAAFAAMAGPGGGGIFAGIGILIGGGLYVILMGGMLYLMLGVYRNTQRAADALERLENK